MRFRRELPTIEAGAGCVIVRDKRIYCERKYHAGAESEEMFRKVGIEIEFKFDEEQKYPDKCLPVG